MQKLTEFPQNNYLLSRIIMFLHGEDDDFENLKSLADSSSIPNLVFTLSFLINWLSNHLDHMEIEELYDEASQNVFQLINYIMAKISPVILYQSLPENIVENSNSSHWILGELIDPIRKRIIRLRSYIQPYEKYDFPCMIPHVFNLKRDSKGKKIPNKENTLRIEKKNNSLYESKIRNYIKSLIMNHVPIQYFDSFLAINDSRSIVTKAFIEILEELNQSREATHEELLFAFSSVFFYVYAFACSNEIDGQSLCRYLRSRSYLSPFCLLGMSRYIISYLYLFNLLVPSDLSSGDADQKSKFPPYIFIDLTKDKALSFLIDKIPLVLSNYFCNEKKDNDAPSPQMDEYTKFYYYVFLSNIENQQKMKVVLHMAKNKLFPPVFVYSMGLTFLRYVLFSLNRNLVGCYENSMFTPNFSMLIKTICSILATTFSELLASRFYGLVVKDNKTVDIILNLTFLYMMPIIVRNPTQDNLISYCLKAISDNSLANNGRIVIAKLLKCDHPKMSELLNTRIKSTKDLLTLLIYIDTLTNFKNVVNFKEANKIEECCNSFLLQLTGDDQHVSENFAHGKFIFRPFRAWLTTKREFNSLSTDIIKAFENPDRMTSLKELLNIPSEENPPWIILAFAMTDCIEDPEFAKFITDVIIKELDKKDQARKINRLDLIKSDYYYVVSLHILSRLVSFSYAQEAVNLSISMIPYLQADMTSLHFITSFLNKYRPICPIGVLESFSEVVANLPCADEYYVPISNVETITNNGFSPLESKVFRIVQLLDKNVCKIIQDPKVVVQEYQSPFHHAVAFSICALSLMTSKTTAQPLAPSLNSTDLDLSSTISPFDFENTLMDFTSSFGANSNFESTSTFESPSKTQSFSNEKSPFDIVPDSLTLEIAEALLSPATNFSTVWPNRESSVKICALMASKLDDQISQKYFDLIVNNNGNNELLISAGKVFLLNVNLNILEYACRSLSTYMNNSSVNFGSNRKMDLNMTLDFFMRILVPSVWRICGNKKLGLDLIMAFLKPITKDTPKSLFNLVIDITSYVFIKIELYDERVQILKFAEASGFSPQMISAISSSLPQF